MIDKIKLAEQEVSETLTLLTNKQTADINTREFGHWVKCMHEGDEEAIAKFTEVRNDTWLNVRDENNQVVFSIPPVPVVTQVVPTEDLSDLLHTLRTMEDYQPGVHDTDSGYALAGEKLFGDRQALNDSRETNAKMWESIYAYYGIGGTPNGVNPEVVSGEVTFDDGFD